MEKHIRLSEQAFEQMLESKILSVNYEEERFQQLSYSKKEMDSGVYFVMKEVVLGPSLGKDYVILEG